MSRLSDYIEELKDKYGHDVVIEPAEDSPAWRDAVNDLPGPLKELYSLCSAMELPFGEIYRADDREAQQYFSDEGWFCFGFDGYFSYWLCAFEPDEDGMTLTSWDHESGTEIEAVWDDMAGFLRAMEREAEDR